MPSKIAKLTEKLRQVTSAVDWIEDLQHMERLTGPLILTKTSPQGHLYFTDSKGKKWVVPPKLTQDNRAKAQYLRYLDDAVEESISLKQELKGVASFDGTRTPASGDVFIFKGVLRVKYKHSTERAKVEMSASKKGLIAWKSEGISDGLLVPAFESLLKDPKAFK